MRSIKLRRSSSLPFPDSNCLSGPLGQLLLDSPNRTAVDSTRCTQSPMPPPSHAPRLAAPLPPIFFSLRSDQSASRLGSRHQSTPAITESVRKAAFLQKFLQSSGDVGSNIEQTTEYAHRWSQSFSSTTVPVSALSVTDQESDAPRQLPEFQDLAVKHVTANAIGLRRKTSIRETRDRPESRSQGAT